jgi:hypothetical protein
MGVVAGGAGAGAGPGPGACGIRCASPGISVKQAITAIILSAMLLGGAAVDRLSMLPPGDARPYHQAVRKAVATVPARIGDWVGEELAISSEAVDLLRPNVIISRRYTHLVSGRSIHFLLVQCTDVRDLIPHYPPICYSQRGLYQASAERRTWTIGAHEIQATEYAFESGNFSRPGAVLVENFMLLPNGNTSPDMEGVKARLSLRSRYYGAGQIQVVFDDSIPAPMRDAAFVELLAGYQAVIDAILANVSEK